MEHNIYQDNIIKSNNNYTLVIACPGSGKTFTLIEKYKNILNDYEPESIILITFTKKAGVEMNKRILQHNIKSPYYVGSLHGLAYKILSNNNILSNFTIIDETHTTTYLLNLINNHETFKSIDNNEKMKIINDIDKININYPINITNIDKDIKDIYKQYNKFKKKNKLFDFNDLMILLCKFLDSNNNFINNIKYIFFDEYQDINPIQQYILKKFSNSNIVLFGDDAQSIYSFRGSSINFILNFDKNFNYPEKTTQTYYLIDNYRSTPEIINFCQSIINNNNKLIKKNVKTNNNNGTIPLVYGFKYKNQEYDWVVQDIKKKGLNNVAILSRNNYELNNIETYLIDNNISYTKQLNNSLLNKNHVKLYIYIIILINNPNNYYYWELLLNKSVKNKSEIKLLNPILYNLIYNKLYDNIINYLKLNNYEIKDIETLKQFMVNNDYYHLFLNQEIDLDENKICLSTIHSAKGLEWDNVYIIGMSYNQFPNIKSKYYLDEINEVEEERRLLYVACSRAKKTLTLTFVNNPSSFISEINPELYILKGYEKPLKMYPNTITNFIKLNGYKHIIKQLLKYELKIINYNNDNYYKINNINDINILNICTIILNNNMNEIKFYDDKKVYILSNINIDKIKKIFL